MNCTYQEAIAELKSGKAIIYPTETFYALGCVATHAQVTEQIFELKGRDRSKPLPILISDWNMASKYLDLDTESLSLARLFWPGPLSIVTKVSSSISRYACDMDGHSAVRMTPHPVGSSLCAAIGAPLISSSANLSGANPVANPNNLDPELTYSIPVLAEQPWPQGGLPSTLVKIEPPNVIKILRQGAVSATQLRQAGFTLNK